MRDMEIRGAGNLLGPEQHGYVNAVGLDLYGQLLSDEIEHQKNGGIRRRLLKKDDPSIEIPVSAYLPETYLPSESDRVLFYKRLLDAPLEELENLSAELEDRCAAECRNPPDGFSMWPDFVTPPALDRRSISGWSKDGLEIRFAEGAVLAPGNPGRAHAKIQRPTLLSPWAPLRHAL
jgi:hypothetical protein